MIAPLRGLSILVTGILLAGCIAPMSAREARDIAHTRLDRYCRGHCGTLAWSNTQKIKDRWLVDFEAPRHKFTVIVEEDGNSTVTTWEKGVPPP
ncbi:MAG TPA: hypothetical protein VHY57_04035 [Rhizomicrobium sp.]|nr:hypothetical protein [Rhizomicrobium sp.]